MSKYLAVSADREGQLYSPVKGAGKAHLIMIRSAERAGGDHLAFDESGKIDKQCGGKLTASNLVSGASSAVCDKCARFMASDEYRAEIERVMAEVERAEAEYVAQYGTCEADASCDDSACDKIHTLPTDSPKGESTPKEGADMSDGPVKCSVKGRDKIEAVEGTDADGISGQCPECQTVTGLTGKGFIGAHRVGNAPAPKSPALSESSVPTVLDGSRGGVVADAARKRDAEGGEIRKGEREIPTASVAPSGRTRTMTDGPALVKGRNMAPVQPTSGYQAAAGTMAGGLGRDQFDKTILEPEIVGGRYGYLTSDEYEGLTKTQRRRYWDRVKTNKDRATTARQIRKARSVAMGESIPAAERKARRKAASIKNGSQGQTQSHHTVKGEGATAEESQRAAA